MKSMSEQRKPVIEIKNAYLDYGIIPVLKNLNASIYANEIHALIGEHGAGKSSLAKMLSGFQPPKTGNIYYDGERIKCSPGTAKRLGIEMVTQDNHLFPNLTVANNIVLGENDKSAEHAVSRFFDELEIDISPKSLISNLNLSDRVMVDICKHFYNTPKVLILDEALEKLSASYLEKVIQVLHRMKEDGCAILFITHRVDDIYEIADKVSIIRNGNIIATQPVEDIDKFNLIKMAYTQVIRTTDINYLNADFYNLLKYNEAVLKKLPSAILISDEMLNVRFINDIAKNYFEIDESVHPRIEMKQVLGEENSNVFNLLQSCIAERNEEIFYDVQVQYLKGLSSQNISIIPLFDGKLFIGSIITMDDVTEYETLRRQLSIKENLSSIGLLSAGVAHEINNPLEIINYYMQNLKLTNPDNEKIMEIVVDVQEEIKSISNIIDNLLLFSEDKKLTAETVEVNSLISGIVHLITKSTEERKIDLVFDTENEDIYIKTVRTELKQVFLNIIKNSIDAIKENGRISVSTALKLTDSERPVAEITFSDDGPGVDSEIIDNIFMPFYTTKTGSSNNMGLGLSISYRIVDKYGGTMDMNNLTSGGCRTTLTFPAAVE
ncbi:MAG: ATP-binding cassette domain-containing protein [Spirochaetales bacterium]|uniref:histidine kinase n=1 Tax=Candidatus Thalassospirochaeta sargassi TaxID=3119039 RepID=A0AAJ1IB63_9SPIO|nr:ATP-binding cassette domain-containing protein [Spirochaetales bacterium]